ncbi:CopG family transcriptional regulator [Alcaligenaceae bacterium]|nr:CopG family transcriptional regulator [Alcaligenaceae bacterium]
MKVIALSAALMFTSAFALAATDSITVYQDPNCGCCTGWADHMREAGFTVKAIKTSQMASVKEKLGVPVELASCHTAVMESTGQIVEGHVPATAVDKMLANRSIKGVAAPGMPVNSPGMGKLDGNLVTVDFNGVPFSKD